MALHDVHSVSGRLFMFCALLILKLTTLRKMSSVKQISFWAKFVGLLYVDVGDVLEVDVIIHVIELVCSRWLRVVKLVHHVEAGLTTCVASSGIIES